MRSKTHLSRFVHEVREGTVDVVIAVDGVPAVQLVPYTKSPRRVLRMDRGLVKMADNFDAPNEEIANLFEGRA